MSECVCAGVSSESKKVASPKARKGGTSSGTGYGGDTLFQKGSGGATAAAAQRQNDVDAAMTRLLADIRACLVHALTAPQGVSSRCLFCFPFSAGNDVGPLACTAFLHHKRDVFI